MCAQERAGFKEMMNAWNRVLAREIENIFGVEARFVYLEAGKAEVDRLASEGVVLLRDTPLETINAVYGHFKNIGFFVDARARLAGEKGPGGEDVYELREKGSAAFDMTHWSFCGNECASPVCLCHNMIRYALMTGFGLTIKVLESRIDDAAREEVIKAVFEPVDVNELKPITLLEELRSGRAEIKKLSDSYSRAVEMSIDAIVCSDEDGRITLWNRAAEKIFGYTAKEAIGLCVAALVPDELKEKHREGMARFVRTGESSLIGKVVKVEGLRKDGASVPIEMSLSANNVDGKWVFMAILRDNSERNRLEDEAQTRLIEMERLTKLMVGRELKMEELRKEVMELRSKTKTG